MAGKTLGRGFKIVDGKVVKVAARPRDASHAIAMKKSKRQRVVTYAMAREVGR